ncbi:hypothetical protein ACFVIM_15595 [Streptomyces sp. NPDC057638]|uniref:hypothetical protein n=1 Tax=Streptomyces sp. NPDC057638 TaxID=3346190 RepID=UPI0036880EAD
MHPIGRARVWLTAAATVATLIVAPGLTATAAGAGSPGPDARRLAPPYLNIHQCVYYSASATNHFTTYTPSRDGRFLAGTNASATPDRAPRCGAGDGNYTLVPLLSAARPLDVRTGRYLNVHQCTYFSPSAVNYFSTVVPSGDGRFLAGTNIATTPDAGARCGAGDGNYRLVPAMTGIRTLDLTTGRYVNLHQCVYFSTPNTDHFSTVIGPGGGPYTAGTNVSATADTAPTCGIGSGPAGYVPVPILSGVSALSLA